MPENVSHAAETATPQAPETLLERWRDLRSEEQLDFFQALSRLDAATLFLSLDAADRAFLVEALSPPERRVWLRVLEPDDIADVVQQLPGDEHEALVTLLDPRTQAQVEALLAYRDDVAGGKMSPRYVRIQLAMTAEQAIAYLRLQAHVETVYYAYVLDRESRVLGVVSYRDLLLAPTATSVADIMVTDVVTVPEHMDQEEVAAVLRLRNLRAVPVVDPDGRMQGIVTVDDVVDVEREEATEDIQKIGGLSALDLPYFRTGAATMLRKRGGWLSVLFVGQMLTVTAMGVFQDEIESAAVLALFIPLIISSGGNSGSQASTLIVRAMALGEVRAVDWLRVLRREVVIGLALGVLLAGLGAVRILASDAFFGTYGAELVRLTATVGLSVVAVVTWGTVVGSGLPFLLRRAGADPASASAPLVATAVDITGLLIYLSIADAILLR